MSSRDGNADTIVRLYHRRRGWAWVGFGSLIGLIVYLAVGAALFGNLTGAAETASIIPLFILLVLAVVGFLAVIVDSVRLRRFGKAARDAARGGVAHHPVYAHAHRLPPRHFGSWIWAVFMLATMTAVMVSLLPQEVNGAAYLAGAESQVNFHPVKYVQICGRGVAIPRPTGICPVPALTSGGAPRCRLMRRSRSGRPWNALQSEAHWGIWTILRPAWP